MPEKLLDEDFMRRIEKLNLVSRRIFHGSMKGERRSKRRGFSSEFADYRNYVEGDDLRFIDWNIYGRLDRLFLKIFLEEEDLHLHILLDSSLSMSYGEPEKFQYARKVAAAIAYVGLTNMDRVQLHSFNSGLDASSDALRGKNSSWRLFQFLENLKPEGRTSIADAGNLFSQKARRGGVLIIISDFLDPDGYEDAIKMLTAREMDVYVVHLMSPDEVDPKLVGDLRLVDAEDSAFQEISISEPLLEQYRKTVSGFQESIRNYCNKRGASYSFATTDVPFDMMVLNYLRRGGLLR